MLPTPSTHALCSCAIATLAILTGCGGPQKQAPLPPIEGDTPAARIARLVTMQDVDSLITGPLGLWHEQLPPAQRPCEILRKTTTTTPRGARRRTTARRFTYREDGHLDTATRYLLLPDGKVRPIRRVTATYDATGRLSKVEELIRRRGKAERVTMTYRYEQGGRRVVRQKRRALDDGSGSVLDTRARRMIWTISEDGRALGVTFQLLDLTDPANPRATHQSALFACALDAKGRLLHCKGEGGRTLTRDAKGRLTRLDMNIKNGTPRSIIRFTYDAQGRVTTREVERTMRGRTLTQRWKHTYAPAAPHRLVRVELEASPGQPVQRAILPRYSCGP